MSSRGTANKKAKANKPVTYYIDCGVPGDDGIVDAAEVAHFFIDRIKVDGKTNNLTDTVSVKNVENKIEVTVVGPFSKRYLKYLTKKYLKSQVLRDFMNVISTSKSTYTIKYFKHALEEDEDDE
eukprot:TRINITY_DN20292_c0_g1_i1.p1 TRINITY_DN20292_c0_g1~~TRINITY_DN20292_c0_g1_i1.p1  ORF type:complete len:138 (-),score=42.77 TRINITY_DN20292_c0_g1_i1:8-379(-)